MPLVASDRFTSISSCRIIEADKVRRLSLVSPRILLWMKARLLQTERGRELREKIYFHQAISRSLKAHEIKVIFGLMEMLTFS